MSKAEITIVIPIYNAEDYLRKCIDSAIAQTIQNIKIILVDDGSTDRSGSICDEYAQKDSRISVIHKNNGGVCDARNVGVDAVETKYFTFLESDDWLPEDACEKMWNAVITTDSDFVLGAYYRVSAKGVSIKYPLGKSRILFDKKDDVLEKLLVFIMGLTGDRLKHPEMIDSLLTDTAKLYRTDIVSQNRLKWISRKEIYSDCLDYLLRYTACCKRALYIDEPLYFYRRTNSGSQTAGYRPNTIQLWDNQFHAMQRFIEENQFQHLYEAYYSRICFSIIPIGGNAYRTGNYFAAIQEIREGISKEIYRKAFSSFSITELPMHYRPLFFFAKHRMYRLFYCMTYIMRKMMNRQRGI